MERSSRELVAVVALSIAVPAVAFFAGRWYFEREKAAREAVVARFRAKSPSRRVRAIDDVLKGKTEVPVDALMRSIRDVNYFVSARAAEAVFRKGLAGSLPPEVIRCMDRRLPTVAENTRRWYIALFIANDFDGGFDRAVQYLPGMTSPWSRPFIVQILGIHALSDPKAAAYLKKRTDFEGERGRLAREVLEWMKRPEGHRFRKFFPPQLRISVAPRPR